MDKKGKKNNIFLLVTLIILAIALLIGLTISVSYAIWVYSASQTTENTVVTDCFEIQYTDSDVINLSSAYPIIDSEAINLKPYNFTISNICKTGLSYSVNLEKLSSSTLDPTNIKIKLDNESIYTYGDNGTTTPILSEANSAIEIASGVLGPMSSKTYQLRLWVKSDAVTNDVKNKSFASKIAIKATLNKNATTVNLNANGGNVSSNTISATLNSAIGTLPTPTKENYVFAGWYLDDTYTNKVDETTIIENNNTTLYAKWIDNNLITYLTYLQTIDDTVVYDDTDAKNIRYTSANAKNYVYFNCSDYSDESTCELWRIVGIINGNVRLVRNEVLEQKYTFDEYAQYVNETPKMTNWGDTSLFEILNSTYASQILKTSSSYITDAAWPNANIINLDKLSASEAYKKEMTSKTFEYISLLSYSDYMYSMPSDYWNDEYSSNLSWMHLRLEMWLPTLNGESYVYNYANGLMSDIWGPAATSYVRPAIHLDPDVKIANLDTADGSFINPYKLTI